MLPVKNPVERITVEDYLRAERVADERHVYLDGKVWAMAGESNAHGDITVNLVGMVYSQLKGKPCRARTSNTKVRSGPPGPRPFRSTSGLFSYPDVVVVCGEPEFLDEHTDVLTNPTAVIEVLSPSTEAFDRGEKCARFQRWNPTLTDYLLVSQERPWIDHFTRLSDGTWRLARYEGLEATCVVDAIGCRLPLADVYDRVRFPEAAE